MCPEASQEHNVCYDNDMGALIQTISENKPTHRKYPLRRLYLSHPQHSLALRNLKAGLIKFVFQSVRFIKTLLFMLVFFLTFATVIFRNSIFFNAIIN